MYCRSNLEPGEIEACATGVWPANEEGQPISSRPSLAFLNGSTQRRSLRKLRNRVSGLSVVAQIETHLLGIFRAAESDGEVDELEKDEGDYA